MRVCLQCRQQPPPCGDSRAPHLRSQSGPESPRRRARSSGSPSAPLPGSAGRSPGASGRNRRCDLTVRPCQAITAGLWQTPPRTTICCGELPKVFRLIVPTAVLVPPISHSRCRRCHAAGVRPGTADPLAATVAGAGNAPQRFSRIARPDAEPWVASRLRWPGLGQGAAGRKFGVREQTADRADFCFRIAARGRLKHTQKKRFGRSLWPLLNRRAVHGGLD